MESSCSLTQLEMDAVLQLIHLSGGSSDDLRVLWLDYAVDRDNDGRISAADASSPTSSSSGSINQEKLMLDDEPLPRINHRFGSIVDIYGKTATSLIENRSKKRARF